MKNMLLFGGVVVIMSAFFQFIINACVAFSWSEISNGILNVGLAIVSLINAIIGASILATRIGKDEQKEKKTKMRSEYV